MSASTPRGGMNVTQCHPSLVARLLPDQGGAFAGNQAIDQNTRLQNQISRFTGMRARNVLRVAANVVDGETVTIGADIYEVDIINTDTTRTCTGLNNTNNPVQLTLSGAPGLTINVGDLLRIQTEYFKVLRKISVTVYVLARARCGTTNATHADGQSVFQSNAAPASNISVGLDTTLTPTVFTAAIVAEINNAAAAGERAALRSSTIYDPGALAASQAGTTGARDAARIGKVVASAPTVNEVVVASAIEEASVLATTETLAGANNAWATVTLSGGRANTPKKWVALAIVPTAVEVGVGFIRVPLPFTGTWARAEVRVTASGVAKVWDGGLLLTAGLVSLDNAGATDWAATDTIYLEVGE